MTRFACACGAKQEPIDNTALGDPSPSYVPGRLLEPCTCPRCIGCNQPLDKDQRCDNLDCNYCGLIIVIPDR